MVKKLGIWVVICLLPLTWALAEEGAAPKKSNPVIDVPAGVMKCLYGAFQGFGSMFDGFITGDKPPQGSMAGKQDPSPVTEHDRQF